MLTSFIGETVTCQILLMRGICLIDASCLQLEQQKPTTVERTSNLVLCKSPLEVDLSTLVLRTDVSVSTVFFLDRCAELACIGLQVQFLPMGPCRHADRHNWLMRDFPFHRW